MNTNKLIKAYNNYNNGCCPLPSFVDDMEYALRSQQANLDSAQVEVETLRYENKQMRAELEALRNEAYVTAQPEQTSLHEAGFTRRKQQSHLNAQLHGADSDGETQPQGKVLTDAMKLVDDIANLYFGIGHGEGLGAPNRKDRWEKATEKKEQLRAIIAASTSKDSPAYGEKYAELILAVHRKFPNEGRHETALRYIREAEKAALTGDAAMGENNG